MSTEISLVSPSVMECLKRAKSRATVRVRAYYQAQLDLSRQKNPSMYSCAQRIFEMVSKGGSENLEIFQNDNSVMRISFVYKFDEGIQRYVLTYVKDQQPPKIYKFAETLEDSIHAAAEILQTIFNKRFSD